MKQKHYCKVCSLCMEPFIADSPVTLYCSELCHFTDRTSIIDGNAGNCWLWTGRKQFAGYGLSSYKGVMTAHRRAYSMFKGDVPANFDVRHKCHNTSCVNPQHLDVGTRAQNMEDSFYAGRSRRTLSNSEILLIYNSTGNYVDLAEKFDTSKMAVQFIKQGRNYSWLTGQVFKPVRKLKPRNHTGGHITADTK